MISFTLQQRIYIEDVDAQGIVYHANYLKFFDRARTEMLREQGFDLWQQAKEKQRFFVVRHCDLDFIKPAKLDDLVVLETHMLDFSGARLCFDQSLRKEGQTLVTLKSLLAYVTKEGTPLRLPKNLITLFEGKGQGIKESPSL